MAPSLQGGQQLGTRLVYGGHPVLLQTSVVSMYVAVAEA